jgi:hypothetical protein
MDDYAVVSGEDGGSLFTKDNVKVCARCVGGEALAGPLNCRESVSSTSPSNRLAEFAH